MALTTSRNLCAVLEPVFAEALPYKRGVGYRTAQISMPFKMLGFMDRAGKEMVPESGIEPTRAGTLAALLNFVAPGEASQVRPSLSA